MRILYITNGFPFPLTSGYLRHYFLIKELARKHSVTLFSFVPADFDESYQTALQPYTEQLCVFRRAAMARNGILKVWRGLTAALGHEQSTRHMRAAIARSHHTRPFDVVMLSGKLSLPAMSRIGPIPMVADVCDAASLRMRGRLRIAHWLDRPILAAKWMALRRLEHNVIRRARLATFASARDRNTFASPGDPNAVVVPNGIDLTYWHRASGTRPRNRIVFTGAMHYPPNADAAIHLIRDILPRVQRAIPSVELWVVGRDPTPALKHAAMSQPNATVTGFVDDMRPYLDSASVYAAPLRFGAGIQNKVLEAMAMELPVVASSTAAAGVHALDGSSPPLVVADSAEQFACSLVEQLQSGITTHPASRDYVKRHFSWQRSGDALAAILSRVVTNGVPMAACGGWSNPEKCQRAYEAECDESPSTPALTALCD